MDDVIEYEGPVGGPVFITLKPLKVKGQFAYCWFDFTSEIIEPESIEADEPIIIESGGGDGRE